MSKKDKKENPEELSHIKLEEMLSATLPYAPEIEALETEDDVLTFCLATMSIHISNLVSTFGLWGLAGWEIQKKEVNYLLSNILVSLSRFARTLNYEFPLVSEFRDLEVEIPYEVVVSPMLTCMEMNRALADIAYFIHVTAANGVWAEQDLSEDLDEHFVILLIGIKNICNKFKITLTDLT